MRSWRLDIRTGCYIRTDGKILTQEFVHKHLHGKVVEPFELNSVLDRLLEIKIKGEHAKNKKKGKNER